MSDFKVIKIRTEDYDNLHRLAEAMTNRNEAGEGRKVFLSDAAGRAFKESLRKRYKRYRRKRK